MLKHLRFVLLGLLCASISYSLWAHGDDHKDHAHAAPATVVETSHAVPTLRIESDQFELVARLYPGELGIYIDHWASNTPVLNASVEVELNGKKAVATFHADHGDYAVTDPELLKLLHAEGEHALIFSIDAEKDADLLTGTLTVSGESSVQAMQKITGKPGLWLLVGGVALVLLIGCGLSVRHWLNSRKENRK